MRPVALLLAALLLGGAAPDAVGERGCLACHGAEGRAAVAEMPALEGQQPDYLVIQLILFREGLRQVPGMTEAARGLADAEVQAIADWFAALPSAPDPARGAPDAALAARGAAVAAARNCDACHGRDYAGRTNLPRVNHQRQDYLLHALRGYRDGTRVGMDTQMNGVMHGVSDADLLALAHHLTHHGAPAR